LSNDKLTSLVDTMTSFFEYIDIILRIHWHSLVRWEKKVARSFAILNARCTRSAQITWFQKKLRSLLIWSSAFEFCKNDSKRATFDVIIRFESQSFLKLFQKFKILMFLDERTLKKISRLKVNELWRWLTLSLLIFLVFDRRETSKSEKFQNVLFSDLIINVKCCSFWIILAEFENAWSV
jgi:hypothetical protein